MRRHLYKTQWAEYRYGFLFSICSPVNEPDYIDEASLSTLIKWSNNLERTSVAVPARAEYTDTKQSLLMHTLAAAALPAPVPKHSKNKITTRTIQERLSRSEFHPSNYQNETKSYLAVWDVDVGGPSGSASKSKPTKWCGGGSREMATNEAKNIESSEFRPSQKRYQCDLGDGNGADFTLR
ncbi:hypothetical protein V1478_008965 [Vespula squamosa]|uniref:Uncharacterized protein n=1 Tax=Vespula squamosa TaxID=30214 RepID=A0ABD2AV04_VESSQ